jgi:hypothetical protein
MAGVSDLATVGWTGLLVFQNRSDTLFAMNKTVIEVQVRAVLPTSGGCAIFLGNPDKVFIIYVDQSVGSAITMFMRGTVKERPLTHDLMGHLMTALGAKVERVIINSRRRSSNLMVDRATASPWRCSKSPKSTSARRCGTKSTT